MTVTINALPDGFLDQIWERLVAVDPDDCDAGEQALEAIDAVTDMLHEHDPKRFPLEGEDEGEEDDNQR